MSGSESGARFPLTTLGVGCTPQLAASVLDAVTADMTASRVIAISSLSSALGTRAQFEHAA